MNMERITVEDLRARIEAGEELNLLDVRQQDERDEIAIKPSLFIPLNELPERIAELDHLRNSEIIIYCRSGNRSGQARMFLELSGFTNVRNLFGGMLAWAKQ